MPPTTRTTLPLQRTRILSVSVISGPWLGDDKNLDSVVSADRKIGRARTADRKARANRERAGQRDGGGIGKTEVDGIAGGSACNRVSQRAGAAIVRVCDSYGAGRRRRDSHLADALVKLVRDVEVACAVHRHASGIMEFRGGLGEVEAVEQRRGLVRSCANSRRTTKIARSYGKEHRLDRYRRGSVVSDSVQGFRSQVVCKSSSV